MSDLAELVGAACVLVAFLAVQAGWSHPVSPICASLNAVGGFVLACVAATTSQWGFLLLEGTWSAVAIASLARKASGRAVSSSARPGASPRAKR